MNIPKRVTTKVGDVFKITSDEHGLWYLQLVAIDPANMNSDVIIAIHPKDDKDLLPSEIVKLPYEFCLHTTTKIGVKQGFWEKVGNEQVHIEISKLAFKYPRDQDHVDRSKLLAKQTNDSGVMDDFDSPHWDVWRVGDARFHSISAEEGDVFNAEPGQICAPRSIIDRIKVGRTLFL